MSRDPLDAYCGLTFVQACSDGRYVRIKSLERETEGLTSVIISGLEDAMQLSSIQSSASRRAAPSSSKELVKAAPLDCSVS